MNDIQQILDSHSARANMHSVKSALAKNARDRKHHQTMAQVYADKAQTVRVFLELTETP